MQRPVSQQTLQPPPRTQTTRDFYEYALDFGTIAPGSSKTGNIQIQADSAFLWRFGTYWAGIPGGGLDQTADTQVIPPLTIQIADSGSGRQLTNIAIPIDASPFSRQSGLPFPLTPERIFEARSNIQFTVNSLSAATNYRLFIVLHGEKIFYM